MDKYKDNFCGTILGPLNQLEVLDVIDKKGYSKVYSVHCNICANDEELFGNGVFTAFGSNLKKGYLPCGCGNRPLWSEDQFKILCQRECNLREIIFLGWAEGYRGNKTFCKLECPKHGEWTSTDINHLFMKRGCPSCKANKCAESAKGNTYCRKENSWMIEKFMSSGGFAEGTEFLRCSFETHGKSADHWEVSCPDCGTKGVGRSSNISLGYRPCGCTKSRQKFSYINGIYKENILIALKFGIAVNPHDRVKKQNLRSVFEVKTMEVWEYEDYQSCRAAENEIKSSINPIISKVDMLDGYTETTEIENLGMITQIFKKHGGWRILRSDE